jgi:hypothetical protein
VGASKRGGKNQGDNAGVLAVMTGLLPGRDGLFRRL